MTFCKFVGAGRVPKGGDGSALVPYPHKRWESGWSAYDFPEGRQVWCEGRFRIGDRVTEDVR